ncbi:hypothetical protein N7495_003336 [Penicillium taxi]|uniref:uncharacterized protein n=1 Tax=Penicillium taxi TaxID=168475 RepID=UPI0025454D66|nr:uncharacterized protein N7495_003336 [Penicillium taxi]KAJ5902808.1 hypothetical protein N7495_003336 [Penicillium taxi]
MANTSRIWLITGTSSGFGLELAKVAAQHGDRVLATTRSPHKLAKLESSNPNIKAVYLDHNEPPAQIQAAVKTILAVYGTVDIVVNNAAYVQTGVLEETTPEETQRQFQANTFGPLNLYRAQLPHLRAKGSGTLTALRWLGLGLAGEISQFGISHCLVEPGFFRTELLNPTANITTTAKSSRLSAYQELNDTTDSNFAAFNGAQLGDPVKGAKVIYDVATSTGVAEGKPLPVFLPLGSDDIEEITKAASETLAVIKEWREISSLTDLPKGS